MSEPSGRHAVGTLWRDREGIVWRLDHYCQNSMWCILRAVDHPNWSWHVDPIIDLKPPKAVPVDEKSLV